MLDNSAIDRRLSINWIMLIYFVSGVCALIDEVIWVRLLKLTLGNTVYATSIVVSVFMAGLALGALIMSRYSDRIVKHLQLYAFLEALVTIFALCIPFALKLTDSIYVWFYRTYYPSNAQLLIIQVLISTLILLVPTMLMGSTLPLLGRFITALEKEAGHLVGKLYAVNTLGAAVGCFLAGFVLIRILGIMGTLYTAAGLNLLVVLGGWLLSRFPKNTVEEQLETFTTENSKTITSKIVDIKFYILVLAFFLQGLISIGYELLWMRSIVHLLGGFTYVFSAVLTIYLLGNVIGAGIGSKLAKRLKEPAGGFAMSLSVLGLFGILYLLLLILWSSKILPHLRSVFNSIPISIYLMGPLLQSAFLFLVPSIIMGIGFPLALQAWTNHMHRIGQSTGTAYGANTIGAVIGGIVTGFVLIPLLGVELSFSILGLAGIWIGCIMYFLFVRHSKEKLYLGLRLSVVRGWALGGLAVILTIYVVKNPFKLFNTVVNTGPFIPTNSNLVLVKEGLTTTVSLHRNLNDDSLSLYSSGQHLAGDNLDTRVDQKMLGHLGVLLNASAQKVLTIGFGSGETTACLAMHNLERVDCVEIAPEVVDVSLKFFKHINLGDKLNEKINMIYMDAKNYIHLTNNKYDVIINDSIHPRDFAENASLYAKDFFEHAKECLNDNGIIVVWVPMYNMPISALNSIVGTFGEVFPHVTLWHPNRDANFFWIIGSNQPQYYSPVHIEDEMLKDGIQKSLSEINIYNSIDVLSCYVGDENDLKKHITTFYTNSDYSPFVEFTTDSVAPIMQIFKQFVMNIRSNSIYDHIDWRGFTKEEKEKWITGYRKLHNASTYLLMVNSTDKPLEQLKYCMEGLSILPDNPALLDIRRRIEERILSVGISMIESDKINDALNLSEEILKIYPDSAIAWIIKSTAIGAMGDMQKALTFIQKAVELAPDNPYVHFRHGFVLYNLGKFEKAITEYKVALQVAEESHVSSYHKVRTLESLSIAYSANGQIPEAISTAETALNLALSKGDKETAKVIQKQLILFKSEK